jgi:hypothetical protein
VLDWLHLFQKDLRIGGTIEPSTVREVLKVVTQEDLPNALKFVSEKMADRRRRDYHYRERVDFGLVLTILRQDYTGAGLANMPSLKQADIFAASAVERAISRPPIAPESNGEPRRATRDGLSRAGDILKGRGPINGINGL